MNGSIALLTSKYRQFGIEPPRFHAVLGSGLGLALAESRTAAPGWQLAGELPFKDVPGINPASAPGHSGVFKYFRNEKSGHAACFQVGRLHGYEGLDPSDVVRPVLASYFAGTKQFILTNAAGSLHRDFGIGSVMLLRDHVNLTGKNPLVGRNPLGPDGKECGPRFPDLSRAYDRELSAELKKILAAGKFEVHEGVYLGLLGPSFETPAEIALFARWGLDAVGMSTVWEAIALKHAGARLCALSFISNLGCGLVDKPLDHDAVLDETSKSAKRVVDALFAFAAQSS